MEQISASTEEQAATSNTIKDGMNQISATVEENASSGEELASSAQTMTLDIQQIINGSRWVSNCAKIMDTNRSLKQPVPRVTDRGT